MPSSLQIVGTLLFIAILLEIVYIKLLNDFDE